MEIRTEQIHIYTLSYTITGTDNRAVCPEGSSNFLFTTTDDVCKHFLFIFL